MDPTLATPKKTEESVQSPNPINWKQTFASASVTIGFLFAIFGGYLTIKTFDRNYELDTSAAKVKSEAILDVQKQSADQYRAQIGEIRKTIIALESYIEKIDPEKIQKDQKSGLLLSGENLKLSKDVQSGLENLNKEVFRLPTELSAPVNQARSELFNRFQNKVFNKLNTGSQLSTQENPFFVREFDSSTEQGLKSIIKNEK